MKKYQFDLLLQLNINSKLLLIIYNVIIIDIMCSLILSPPKITKSVYF